MDTNTVVGMRAQMRAQRRLLLLPGEQESQAVLLLLGVYPAPLAGPAAAQKTPALPGLAQGQELSQPGFPELLHSQTRQGPATSANS